MTAQSQEEIMAAQLEQQKLDVISLSHSLYHTHSETLIVLIVWNFEYHGVFDFIGFLGVKFFILFVSI